MSSPEFFFYQQLPLTVANVIRRSISQGNIAQAERLLAGKPPAVLAEFNAWKTSPDCFLTVLPNGIRNVVNNYIQNSNYVALKDLIYNSKNAAAIGEFEKWVNRNNIPLSNLDGSQMSINSPPPPYEQLPPKTQPRTPPHPNKNSPNRASPGNQPESCGTIPPMMNPYQPTRIFRRTLTIPGRYMPLVIGTKGNVMKGIQSAYNIKIFISSNAPTTAPVQVNVVALMEENLISGCLEIYGKATSPSEFKALICDSDIAPQVLKWDGKRLFDFTIQFNTFPSTKNNVLELRAFDKRSLEDAQKELKDLYCLKREAATVSAKKAPKKKKKKAKKNQFCRPVQPVVVSAKINAACVNLRDNTNILVLGASGVGKSTFLNSITNYFAFGENYAQARKGMTCTIGMEYTKYDEKKNAFNVVLTPQNNDDADNENQVTGESCTIDARCYSFKYAVKGKEKFIRIIDTPGLLDTAGVIKDSENLSKILSYLKNFPDLHAICILLKPTESKLTVGFKYYINELLSRLHKDAAKNIVYCFTNTMGTNFTPGDTLGVLNCALKELNQANGVNMKLDKNNMFCFDNDGFRYFAAQKFAGFPNTGEEGIAQKNWVESAKETERFIQMVAKLPSYEVGKSLAIHQARDTLKALAEPMAEKAKTIFMNKREIKHKIEEIHHLRKQGTDLDQRLKYRSQQYQKVPVSMPRIVCKACAEGVGKNIEILNVCHNNCPCLADHVPMGQSSDVKLCTIFADDGVLCSECGCPWNAHERVNYDVVEYSGSVVDVVVQNGIDRKEAQRLAAQEFIQRLQEENDRLDLTLHMLGKQSAAFASFVRKHSLVVTNDAFSGYIDLCIQSAKFGSKPDLTEKMEEFKEKYEQELELYKNSGSASDSLTFENINEKLEELLNDPDLGIYLSSIKEFLEDTPDSSELDKECKKLSALFGKMTI